MIDPTTVEEFLAQRRIAVIGASDKPGNFGGAVYRALRDHGYDAVPVNPSVAEIDGTTCYPDVFAVPGDIDGAILMVNRAKAPQLVEDCAARGVLRLWLFKGLGSPGAVSGEAVSRAERHGMQLVAGACPFMFLEPVAGFHRFHRGLRRLNGSLAKAS